MKRLFYVFAVLLIAIFAGAQNQTPTPSQSQNAPDQGVSLGDAARAIRAQKTPPSPNAKVYTNDNLPTAGSISTTTGDFGGIAPPPADKSGKPAAKDKDKSAEDANAKLAEDYKGKVADLKKQIDGLKHDIDIMQREDKLRQAAFYGDAGLQARPENQQKYQEQTKKYQDDLKAKQDQLDAANQQLEQLREEIRKAGLPSSVGE